METKRITRKNMQIKQFIRDANDDDDNDGDSSVPEKNDMTLMCHKYRIIIIIMVDVFFPLIFFYVKFQFQIKKKRGSSGFSDEGKLSSSSSLL
ncbi:hypothetical protein DERF_015817 [Dermatophagoides farinae]|uniref:Transmembrane protein n=1 Tax=Dermatophagoides farinae TaxID=6954 RepID=A0A922KRK2_DERFA|nr:hypothetical protein DERF_015817 [Dermatophagoides farinae]